MSPTDDTHQQIGPFRRGFAALTAAIAAFLSAACSKSGEAPPVSCDTISSKVQDADALLARDHISLDATKILAEQNAIAAEQALQRRPPDIDGASKHIKYAIGNVTVLAESYPDDPALKDATGKLQYAATNLYGCTPAKLQGAAQQPIGGYRQPNDASTRNTTRQVAGRVKGA